MHILNTKTVAAANAGTRIVLVVKIFERDSQEPSPPIQYAFEPSQPFGGQEAAEVFKECRFHVTGRLTVRCRSVQSGNIQYPPQNLQGKPPGWSAGSQNQGNIENWQLRTTR